jgi:tripartite ATP-independent transporter DctM subunit
MSPVQIILGTFLLLFVLRVPVAFALGASAIVGVLISPETIAISTIPSAIWQSMNVFVLLAIPFFVLLGDLAVASGITSRLVDFAKAFVGHIHGGLAHVCVVVNMIMAGMSGSDLADAAATGSQLIPAMKRAGYPVGYAAAVISGAATIGPLIPPSIAFLIYAAATDSSVGRLFLAGAVPGVLLGLFLMLQAYVVARRNNYPREQRVAWPQRGRETIKSLPVLMIPVLVVGSMLSGLATPTEASVVGAISVLLIGTFFYRTMGAADFVTNTMKSLRTTASIFLLIGMAAAFGRVLTLYGLADSLAVWVTGLTDSQLVFLLCINVVFLVLGCVVDSVPILLVFVPLLMPTVTSLGIDPIHFGVIVVFNLLIGLMTPPYGLQMFLICRIAGISMFEFWRYAWAIFVTMVFVLLLVTVFPQISLFLPNLVFN